VVDFYRVLGGFPGVKPPILISVMLY
jgi:hypothetical protein